MVYTRKKNTKSNYQRVKRYKKRRVTKRKYKGEVIVKNPWLSTPFADEYVAKIKSFVTFKVSSSASNNISQDFRFINSLYQLGQYQTPAGNNDIYPIDGIESQEGLTQLKALYNNYVVMGIKVDLQIQNDNLCSVMVNDFPLYPGSNYTAQLIPFSTRVEDDRGVKRRVINPQTQGTTKIINVKRYLSPYYAFKNSFIKGNLNWGSLFGNNPIYTYALGFRVVSLDRTQNLTAPTVVSGYVTHYCRFYNKKQT